MSGIFEIPYRHDIKYVVFNIFISKKRENKRRNLNDDNDDKVCFIFLERMPKGMGSQITVETFIVFSSTT